MKWNNSYLINYIFVKVIQNCEKGRLIMRFAQKYASAGRERRTYSSERETFISFYGLNHACIALNDYKLASTKGPLKAN